MLFKVQCLHFVSVWVLSLNCRFHKLCAVTAVWPMANRIYIIMEEMLRCRYRTGKCVHPRAVKGNGKLHHLCQIHRAKANWNQKKLDLKRRRRGFITSSIHPPFLKRFYSNESEMSRPLTSLNNVQDEYGWEPMAFSHAEPEMLHEDDIKILASLLSGPELGMIQEPLPLGGSLYRLPTLYRFHSC